MNTDEKNEYLKRVSKLREFIKFTGFYELAKEFGLQYGQKCGDILHKNRCEECLDINNSICPAELELGVELMERTEKENRNILLRALIKIKNKGFDVCFKCISITPERCSICKNCLKCDSGNRSQCKICYEKELKKNEILEMQKKGIDVCLYCHSINPKRCDCGKCFNCVPETYYGKCLECYDRDNTDD
ncbi:MAG: hypothetical protein MUF50_04140 [Planctomycetes bacterium]|jgi:hypothetical protein|nr:hypothetical protein [Planctomycetota bacterium]